MGFLDSLKRWLGREATDLHEAKRDLETRLDRELSARERKLNETPMEAMERLQQEAEANESSFDAISDRIAGKVVEVDPGFLDDPDAGPRS